MKKASLTLEAACVLPFFLTAVIAVLCFMQGISDAGRENEKMSASVKKMAVYAYAGQDTVAANLLKEGDIIEMVYPHRVKFRVPFIHIRNITVWEKFCVRAWTGRIPDGGEGSDEDEKNTKVYVTAEGSVYHRDRQCRHLKRHIEKVAASAVDTKEAVTVQNIIHVTVVRTESEIPSISRETVIVITVRWIAEI